MWIRNGFKVQTEESTFDGKHFRAWSRKDGKSTTMHREDFEHYIMVYPNARGNRRIMRFRRWGAPL